MTASAAVLFVHGILLLFAPELLLRLFALGESPQGLVNAQLFSAALLGIAIMNWTGRGLVLGGIFGRALVVGNCAHSLIGFLVIVRARINGYGNDFVWFEAALYLGFMIAFSVLLLGGSHRHKS